MSRNEIKEKKLAVLKIVREKKEILFASPQNNSVTKKEKEEAWLEVLEKAQSLGLTSPNRQWNYARDHLFGLWKSRTRAKRENSKKTGGRAVVLDEVDEEILGILGKYSPVVEGLGLTKVEDINSQSQHVFNLPQPCSKEYQQKQLQTKRKARDSLDTLRKEVLESELYINKLKILKLEKELGLRASKFTSEFQNHNSNDIEMKPALTNFELLK